jgi:hypothetical protein
MVSCDSDTTSTMLMTTTTTMIEQDVARHATTSHRMSPRTPRYDSNRLVQPPARQHDDGDRNTTRCGCRTDTAPRKHALHCLGDGVSTHVCVYQPCACVSSDRPDDTVPTAAARAKELPLQPRCTARNASSHHSAAPVPACSSSAKNVPTHRRSACTATTRAATSPRATAAATVAMVVTMDTARRHVIPFDMPHAIHSRILRTS